MNMFNFALANNYLLFSVIMQIFLQVFLISSFERIEFWVLEAVTVDKGKRFTHVKISEIARLVSS